MYPPSTGVKWNNVAAGNYTVVAVIDENSCLMDCDDCEVCANHSIRFSVLVDRFTFTHHVFKVAKDFTKIFALSLIGNFFL